MTKASNNDVISPLNRAEATVTMGRHLRLSANAEISSAGLVSVALLISSILLSTAVLVHVAASARRRC
ncbi:hypothetical protein [Agrobacterium vaccinii]|uniref:hypothetical protein n=1 Tax=Agrobacterium vaccinii TaxID=2735528 RepID=UPI000DDB32B8|nr:hypothetical protein [Agrobacterium vaccinii]UHS58596.1 hypothetical protein HRS00_16990 [Agrobacterium vaccinii]